MKNHLEEQEIALLTQIINSENITPYHNSALQSILVQKSNVLSHEDINLLADTCRDIALAIEWQDVDRAFQLISLALSFRPSGPVLQKKHAEYQTLLNIAAAGETHCNGIRLTFGENLPSPLLRALASGSYEQHEAKLLMKFINSDDRVLELGAGIGYMGTLAMTYCKPASYTAYEANPALLPLINNNMKINGVAFTAINALLTAHATSCDFYVTPAFWASSLIAPASGSYEKVSVPAHNKHEVIENIKPTALVIDIEGGEAEFFQGLNLSGVKKIIMEIHPAVLDDGVLSDIYSKLLNEGFKLDFSASSKVVVYWYR
ncbi:FkbM family methyltransferase [Oceanimonas smirnovii]|uniref:FkbM family methyltransferase n=1 Tax=Oceanimonas smirnovii TaxID=264574 RepID=A0ABW7P401_9GAMM